MKRRTFLNLMSASLLISQPTLGLSNLSKGRTRFECDEMGLKLTATEATAILQHRKANGAFKDLAGLLKVAGLDAKKVEAARDSITF